MENEILISNVKFTMGQQVKHYLLEYRGIVVDVDSCFRFSDEEINKVFTDESLKSQPWYQVLVHNTEHLAYVPEAHLRAESLAEEIEHPILEHFFTRDEAGQYHYRAPLQ